MTDTFDNRLTRVPIYTSSPEDVPGPEPMVIPPQLVPTGAPPQEPWYSRASNALLGVLDQFGVAGLPEGERREAVREGRNKLLHIGPMEEQDYLWPEKMLRSGLALAGDVRTGNVPPPGLRREDYTDIPADPSKVGGTPHDDLIQRVQDMAGLAMSGGIAGTGERGMVVGSGATMPSIRAYHGSPERNLKSVSTENAVETRGVTFHASNPNVADTFTVPREYGEPVYYDARGREIKPGKTYATELTPQKLYEVPAADAQRFIDDTAFQGQVIQQAREAGHDAVVARNVKEGIGERYLGDVYAALHDGIVKINKKGHPEVFAKNEAAAPLSALERAPVWYSPVEQALENSTQARATGAQWLATLRNSRGVKPEELDWTGLRQFLEERADQPVSRPELHEYLRDNRVELQDVTKGGHKDWTQEDSARLDDLERRRNDLTDAEEAEVQRLWTLVGLPLQSSPEITKYSSYQLPGGENYREHLITMPIQGRRIGVRLSEEGPLEAYDTATGRTVRNSRGDDNEMLAWAEAENKKGQPTDPREYKSPHWDEPNIVAHVRSNVREMPEPLTAEQQAAVARRGELLPQMSRLIDEQRAVSREINSIVRPLEKARTDKIREDMRAGRISGPEGMRQLEEYYAHPEIEPLQRKLQDLRLQEDALRAEIPAEPVPASKRSLHLEEVQSDWHQAGRREGYKPQAEKELAELVERRGALQKEASKLASSDPRYKEIYQELPKIQTRINEIGSPSGAVPDAPWKKTWHELALRRMIRLAAEEGMDRISWTPGEAQAARYDLSKQIDSLRIWPDESGKYYFEAKKGGRDLGLDGGKSYTPEQLEGIVGKEITKKAVDDIAAGNAVNYSGLDLKVGGEGMRGFYDKMMVQAAEKLGKEYGVKVREAETPGKYSDLKVVGSDRSGYYVEGDGYARASAADRFDTRAEADRALVMIKQGAGAQKIWYFDIPPAMREAALGRGMPLFSGGKMFVPSGAQGSEESE